MDWQCKTKNGKQKMIALRSERVQIINEVFDKINSLVSNMYEEVFDFDYEASEQTKKEIIKTLKKIKPHDFTTDENNSE